MKNYYEIKKFKALYLKDSLVIQITNKENLIFIMDSVLTEEHYLYSPPKINERHCYKKGMILFKDVFSINWKNVNSEVFSNLDYNIDCGNIDKFIFSIDIIIWKVIGACTIYSAFPDIHICE